MPYEHIAYDLADGVLTITLNRPEQLNAFTGTMLRELIDACDRADADDSVRVIIVTGAGRGFCAGADLSGGPNTFDAKAHGAPTDIRENRDGGGRVTLRFFELKKPIIAAINGPAVGVGATMTLAMDIRMASENARMGFVFARRGIVPEACSSWFLPRIVGPSQALEWVSTGRVFGAQEALAGDAQARRGVGHEDDVVLVLPPGRGALGRHHAHDLEGDVVDQDELAHRVAPGEQGARHRLAEHGDRGVARLVLRAEEGAARR